MKKQIYESPEIEFVVFASEDVITTSGSGDSGEEPSVESTQPVLPWD